MKQQPKKTPIITNVYDIPQRLRELDPGYFVLRNHEAKTFEIHHKDQPHNTYCLTVPYEELDERTLQLVRKTRISNIEKILLKMEETNQKLSEEQTKIPEEATEKLRETVTYLSHHSDKEYIDNEAFTTRFL